MGGSCVNRPSQIREVYLELRRIFGGQLNAGEVLRLAALIVKAYREPETLDPTFDDEYGRLPFVALELDTAMEDGGWRILEYEGRRGMALTDDLPDNYFAVEARIRGFVGQTQWPRIAMD